MNSPIYTRIVNKYPRSKVLSWAGTRPIYVPPVGEAIVEGDVWSQATLGQRISIKAEMKTGNVELWVGVLGMDGIYRETRMDVDGTAESTVKYGEPRTVPDKTEIIKAEPKVMDGNELADAAELPPEPEAMIAVTIPDTPQQDAELAARARFMAHVEAKEWIKALEDIKSIYGDSVTFGPRAIMAAKSWDALVTRHKLGLG